MPKLEFLCNVHVDLKPGTAVGAGPSGMRFIVDVAGGTFEGPRLKGRVLESGGDWFWLGNDGVGRIDARITFETDDGAYIYVQYHGVVEMSEHMVAALAGERDYQYGDSYLMTAPRFETGDERYAWLNRIVAVAEGRVALNAGDYRVYQVQPD